MYTLGSAGVCGCTSHVRHNRQLVPRCSALMVIFVVLLTIGARCVSAQAQVSVLIPAARLAWNPATRLLYLLVPASDAAGDKSNSITAIDPFTGQIVFGKFAGSDLSNMCFSSNYKYLYITLGNSIRVMNTADRSIGPMIPIGNGLSVSGMCAAPGKPDCVLIQRQNRAYSPSDNGTVVVEPDGRILPKASNTGHSLVYDRLTDRAYGYENQISSWDLPLIGTDAEGVVRLGDATGMLTGNLGLQGAENGMLFTSNGSVLDPVSRLSLGQISGAGWGTRLVTDGKTGKVYVASRNRDQISVSVVDMYKLYKLGEIKIQLADAPNPTGVRPRRQQMDGDLGDFVRFGDDGLAFAVGGKLWLTRNPLIGANAAPTDLAVVASGLSAGIKPGATASLTATVTNRSSIQAEGVVLTDLVSDNVDIVNVSSSVGSPIASNHNVRLELESLAPGAAASIRLEIKVRQADSDQLKGHTAVTQTAYARSHQFDSNPANNHSVQEARILLPDAAHSVAGIEPHGKPGATQKPPEGPHLSAEWRSIKETSEGAGAAIHNTLVGEIVVKNDGTKPAPRSRMRFFMSATSEYDATFAILLQETVVPQLEPGAKYTAKLRADLRFGDDAIGLYIVAMLNSDRAVHEANTYNNLVSIRVP